MMCVWLHSAMEMHLARHEVMFHNMVVSITFVILVSWSTVVFIIFIIVLSEVHLSVPLHCCTLLGIVSVPKINWFMNVFEWKSPPDWQHLLQHTHLCMYPWFGCVMICLWLEFSYFVIGCSVGSS